MAKALPKRSEVPVEKTWRLEDIFATDDLWREEYNKLKSEIPNLLKYQGRLGESAQTLYELLQLNDDLGMRLGKLHTYAHMRYDQETTNSFYQGLYQEAQMLVTKYFSAISYITPEILFVGEEKINEFFKTLPELELYRKALDDILRRRPHTLSEKEEALLAEASDVLHASSNTFSMLNNADLKFPTIIDENGEEVTLTHGRYIRFMESKDRRVRKDAFEALYKTYGSFKNTFASTLSTTVKAHNFLAKAKNFQSARQMALFENNIPETVYDNLVEAVNENLHLLHRYIKLRKKLLNLDELHMYDIYTPLVQDVEMEVTYEEAQDLVLKGLAPMGEEYLSIIKDGFKNRWIDVEENEGKRSGAYSSGSYGTNPYILLNWQNNMDNAFTLAHELGHSVHSYYTRKYQPFVYGDYSIFVAEVASTCNETLLNDYLLKTMKEKNGKLYIINNYLDGFRGTVFRQTMFAEFEHIIHTKAQEGVPLTAEILTDIYYKLNQKYYGEDIVHDPEIGLEWARIPHFYYNYYVYQYATGFSAASALANQILTEGEPAVERYINFLKAGSSDYPIEVLKKAGVDMTTKEPIYQALKVFEHMLDEMERLLNE
ncbi:MAG: oligoendopeptidase F [Bacilli bacterium]|nr:oligoendopeptidase F [Bacilli bacterium]